MHYRYLEAEQHILEALNDEGEPAILSRINEQAFSRIADVSLLRMILLKLASQGLITINPGDDISTSYSITEQGELKYAWLVEHEQDYWADGFNTASTDGRHTDEKAARYEFNKTLTINAEGDYTEYHEDWAWEVFFDGWNAKVEIMEARK